MALVTAVVVPLIFLSLRRRSISLALYSFAMWNVIALGLIQGVFRKRMSPSEAIDARWLVAAPSSTSHAVSAIIDQKEWT